MARRSIKGAPERRPSAAAAHIGMRLRLRRSYLDVTIEELAAQLGLHPKELATIEAGTTAPDAVFIVRCAQALEIPIAWFYDGLEPSLLSPLDAPQKSVEAATSEVVNALDEKMQNELLGSYFDQLGTDDRQRLIVIARALASDGTKQHG
jgi:transcriptional regulator with XRE-family HTH domain